MNLGRATILALERHFLGSLQTPAAVWLEPIPADRLAVTGAIVTMVAGVRVLDFGTVVSPGEERHVVRIADWSAAAASVQTAAIPKWLQARWVDDAGDPVESGGGESWLELSAVHDSEEKSGGVIELLVERDGAVDIEVMPVRMRTRRLHPAARFNFNGSQMLRPFRFDADGAPYRLEVTNVSSAPLVVSLADLPAWLAIEVGGYRRTGPIAGPFFERTAPVTVSFQPQLLGHHRGSVHVTTNDPGASLLDLPFEACVHPRKPLVRAAAPKRATVRSGHGIVTGLRLENWGRTAASVSDRSLRNAAIEIPPSFEVPAAHDGKPGSATVPVRILATELAPGPYAFPLTLAVADGEPAQIEAVVAIDVDVADVVESAPRPEIVAALIALLVLSVLFLFVIRGLS